MADAPISALVNGGVVQPADNIPVERAGSNFRVQVGKSVFMFAASDETSQLIIGVGKITFPMPVPFLLDSPGGLIASVNENSPPSGSSIIIDCNVSGATILSTKLSIDSGESSSTTAASQAVITTPLIAQFASVSIDIDQVGSVFAGAGLKITMLGALA